MGFQFAYADRLVLLAVVPVLLLVYFVLIWRRRARGKVSGIDNLDRILPKQQAWKRHLAVVFALLSLISLNIAFAQPSGAVDVPRDRATVCVALDVSNSMKATDVSPNRFQAAQEAAAKFIDMMPAGFNTSLVSFYGTSTLLVPPTTDRGLVKRAIDLLQLGPGTAIGDGVFSCLDSLKLAPLDPKHPDSPPPAAIVLLSDGSTNVGRPSVQAGQAAKKAGVPVYTIAYGTPGGFVVVNGRPELVPVDRDELRKLSQVAGGEAFTAGSASELQTVYGAIAHQIGYEKQFTEITERFAGGALVLAFLAALAVMSLAARWP